MWSQFGRGAGGRVVDRPDVLRVEAPVDVAPYNAVVRFCGDDASDDAIDDALAAYRARGVPPVWIVHPTATPHGLGRRLAVRGLTAVEPITGMALDARARHRVPAPADVVVEPVEDANREEWLDLIALRYRLDASARRAVASIADAAGIGRPGGATQAWIARRAGQVVGKVALHLAAGVAGVHGLLTRPAVRRTGLGAHLTSVALDAAVAAGHDTAVLHSTPMAVALYRALGFRPVAGFELRSDPGALHL
ncbi:MAG TPA: GNAT family N-acetyltransferase [Ilumatobacteraceae bacterium]|nr:GNAT family N-acetyltransferase [Ilumatobacteraceae bacterium]